MKKKSGRIITITSSKGGVGKTIFLMNLAGVYANLGKKVLLLDFDFTGGCIALNLKLEVEKTAFHIVDDFVNGCYRNYKNYIMSYNENIDVVPACKDPRQFLKMETKYLTTFLRDVEYQYDVILIDTTHGLTKDNLLILDQSDTILYMVTNDFMDLKNTKAFMDVISKIEREDVKVVLNNSKDLSLNYFSKYDIKSIIKRNIDYTLSMSMHIKNITSFLLEGEIFTLNRSLTFNDKKDLGKLETLALDLLEE